MNRDLDLFQTISRKISKDDMIINTSASYLSYANHSPEAIVEFNSM